MRHLRKGRKFSRERNQRRALMKSLASSFFVAGRIRTTEAKAKELRPFVEKFIARAQNPKVDNRRFLRRFFSDEVVKKIIEYADLFRERRGGYTRIIKTELRKIDSAKMAIIELVKS